MKALTLQPRRSLIGLAAASAAVCLWLAGTPTEAEAAEPAADGTVHHVRIARQRPPCEDPAGMPIVPNDPGALVTPGGTRCYGTRPPELELWLPEDRYLWLDRGHAHSSPNPAAWIDLGPVVVDPATLEVPPLGLRLSGSAPNWTLETRHGQTATLTALEAGTWQEITSPDGQRFWIHLDTADAVRPRGQGRVRYRAD